MNTTVTPGRTVSGKTKAARKIVTIAAPVASSPAPGTNGGRVVSGATKAARGATVPMNTTPNNGQSDGSQAPATTSRNPDGSRVVSGATMAARNTHALIVKLSWGFGIGALVVGSIFVVRKYHLLTGGR